MFLWGSYFYLFVFNMLFLIVFSLSSFYLNLWVFSYLGLSLSVSSGKWSFIFFVSLILIVSFILMYSVYYLDFNNNLYYHLWMFLFAVSMVLLIFHNNLFLLIVGWDGLGITSFLLVYYYSNWNSINSAFVTVLSNRVGDVLMLWFIVQMLFYSMFSSSLFFLFLSLVVLFFAGITKSAQFPFSSWLPQAMAAPTPTSALVHSSTLVTAGIYLFIKYNFFLMKVVMLLVLFMFGFITICVSGLVSLVEKDSKKVIALSTLNQLGFMVSTLGMGNKFLTFFHLITHAFFKSCMFLQMGFFIHNTFSNQDFRNFSYSLLSSFSSVLIFLVCLLSLSGVIFLSGFISKEAVLFSFIYSVFYSISLLLLFFMVIFTLLYSFRLISMVLNSNYYFEVNKNFIPTVASLFLLVCGVVLGIWLSEMIFINVNVFGSKEVLLVYTFFLLFMFFISSYFFLNFISNMMLQDSLYKKTNYFLAKFNILSNFYFLFIFDVLVLSFWNLLFFNNKFKYSLFIMLLILVLFFV